MASLILPGSATNSLSEASPDLHPEEAPQPQSSVTAPTPFVFFLATLAFVPTQLIVSFSVHRLLPPLDCKLHEGKDNITFLKTAYPLPC